MLEITPNNIKNTYHVYQQVQNDGRRNIYI